MNIRYKFHLNAVSISALAIVGMGTLSHSVLAAEDASARKPVVNVAAKSKSKPASADDTKQEAKSLTGMSILGNQEAPKALVIVPWKSSQLGDALDISKTLDDSRQPVDKDVFMRELAYYEIRSGSK